MFRNEIQQMLNSKFDFYAVTAKEGVSGVEYILAPSVEEMYPTPDTRHFEFPPVSTVMEGAHRPGHFNGVCQVVSRLFYIVKPDRAYFGEKDWQQIAVIKAMVRHLGFRAEDQ